MVFLDLVYQFDILRVDNFFGKDSCNLYYFLDVFCNLRLSNSANVNGVFKLRLQNGGWAMVESRDIDMLKEISL